MIFTKDELYTFSQTQLESIPKTADKEYNQLVLSILSERFTAEKVETEEDVPLETLPEEPQSVFTVENEAMPTTDENESVNEAQDLEETEHDVMPALTEIEKVQEIMAKAPKQKTPAQKKAIREAKAQI